MKPQPTFPKKMRFAPRLAAGLAAGLTVCLCVVLGVGPAWAATDAPTDMEAVEHTVPLPPPRYTIDPTNGIAVYFGMHRLQVQAQDPPMVMQDTTLLSSGADFGVDFIWPYYRIGYSHQIYRHGVPAGTRYQGQELGMVGYDADQLWLFVGPRPHPRLFMGLGVGYQYRLIRYQPKDPNQTAITKTEKILAPGALLEWAFSPPFSLGLRQVWEPKGNLLQVTGPTLFLSMTVSE